MTKLIDDVVLDLPDQILAIQPDEVVGMAECQVFLQEGVVTTTTMLAVLQFQEQHDIKKLSLFVMEKPIMTILKDY